MRVRRGCRIGLILFACSVVAIGLWLYFWLFYDLPSPENFGTYIAESNSESHYSLVPLSEIPEVMRWAVIASGDRDFYARSDDLDPVIIPRAIWYYWHLDEYGRDGASLNEMLVLNLMSVSGKRVENSQRQGIRELISIILSTQRYTKDEILEFYLNSVYYGDGVYGVEAAAQFYFGKHIRDLDLAECVMLAFIPRVADFDLLGDPEIIERGQMSVLAFMVEEGYISREEAVLAQQAPIVFVNQ